MNRARDIIKQDTSKYVKKTYVRKNQMPVYIRERLREKLREKECMRNRVKVRERVLT